MSLGKLVDAVFGGREMKCEGKLHEALDADTKFRNSSVGRTAFFPAVLAQMFKDKYFVSVGCVG